MICVQKKKNSMESIFDETSANFADETQASAPRKMNIFVNFKKKQMVSHKMPQITETNCISDNIVSKPTLPIKREGFILSYTTPLLDFYDIDHEMLGQGTYGSVCRAVHKSTNCIRAVKTISKAKVKNPKRFKQEIDIMRSLDHPNIIKLYETFEDHKHIYLVMELCRGGELFDRIIEEGFFSEMQAGALMRSIFAALVYIHKNGIVHRDLKPENFIFLDKQHNSPIKLIDFGLASRFTGNTALSTKAGTPYYVAPQVLQGKYTYKCDMWSAGVILYILLCGYPPFHGENDAEILNKVKAGRFTFNDREWKNISGEAKDLTRRLLHYDPKQRLSAEQALNHPWIRIYTAKPNPVADEPLSRHIIENFRSFQALTKLKKAALTVIAQQLSETKIETLKQIFLSMDENGDGSLTVQELRAGLRRSGLKELPSDLEALIQEVDSDGSGVIDYTEFIAATLDKRQYIQEDICWAAFHVFDNDNSGKISAMDLAKVLLNADLQKLYPKVVSIAADNNNNTAIEKKIENPMIPKLLSSELLQVKEIQQIIQEVDRNGDGEIDFSEFMEMMRRGSS